MTLQTTAPYSTGTVAVVNGSNAITLSGGTWTAAMSGMKFYLVAPPAAIDSPYPDPAVGPIYTFTFVTGTTGTLDRAYGEATNTAAPYSIFQHIYTLPANCGLLRDDAITNSFGTMKRFSWGQLNDGDATRSQTGEPWSWASHMDDASTPPNMRVEVYPVPDAVYTLPLEYTAEVVPLGSTSTILQVWVQPAALIEGATSKIKAHLKDYPGAQFHMATAEKALNEMRRAEAQGMGPAQMQLSPYFTAYRSRLCYR